MNQKQKQVLALGAGVQSSTLALMAIHGELPKPDVAIFSDTGWEPKAVYAWLEWLSSRLDDAGIPLYRVGIGNIKQDSLDCQVTGIKPENRRWGAMPLFVLHPDGGHGQIRRQCTYEYKIRAIDKCIRREVLGLKHGKRAPKGVQVQQWFGISWDERRRMKLSEHKWKEHTYPLVERHMTRLSCLNWMRDNGYPEPPRSACIGCPYRSNREWRNLTSDEFEEACQFDEAIRNCSGMQGETFLHSERIPLREVDLTTDVERGQLLLAGFEDECSGMCGV